MPLPPLVGRVRFDRRLLIPVLIKEEAEATNDQYIGNVEYGKTIFVLVMHVEEIDHVAIADPIENIAQGPTQDQYQRQ